MLKETYISQIIPELTYLKEEHKQALMVPISKHAHKQKKKMPLKKIVNRKCCEICRIYFQLTSSFCEGKNSSKIYIFCLKQKRQYPES